jgi:hypothetical protein
MAKKQILDSTVLVLASGLVNENLYGELGKIYTSHIPISGKLAIKLLLDKVHKDYNKKYILIEKNGASIIPLLRKVYSAEIILGNYKDSYSNALYKAISTIANFSASLDIIYGDSLSTDLILNSTEIHDAIYVSRTSDNESWTSVLRRTHDSKLEFNVIEGALSESLKVTGSFKISQLNAFLEIFKEKLAKGNNENAFWQTWVEYDRQLDKKVELILDKSWRDIGHFDTYFDARRNLIKSTSRAFNNIELNFDADTIVKNGNLEKINSELNWFQEIPINLKKFVPKVYAKDTTSGYEIDYITTIPMNEMWISENSDDSYWTVFAKKFENLIFELHRKNSHLLSMEEIESRKKIVYIDKFNSRIEELLKSTNNYVNLEENLTLNGVKLPKLKQIIESIFEVTNRVIKLDAWSVIHGDLCLSNIFFDRRKSRIYLIDPRGNFGKQDIYGDPIYDLVKFSHSVFGDYDYFACDLFDLSYSGTDFRLVKPNVDKEKVSRKICRDLLLNQISTYNVPYTDLRVLESSLFLSAASLHLESNRSLALFVHGLEIANEVLSL